MDKEMKNMRELSMYEMDKVSGGCMLWRQAQQALHYDAAGNWKYSYYCLECGNVFSRAHGIETERLCSDVWDQFCSEACKAKYDAKQDRQP